MFRPEHITLERTLISLWLTQKEATQYGGKGDTGMLDKWTEVFYLEAEKL